MLEGSVEVIDIGRGAGSPKDIKINWFGLLSFSCVAKAPSVASTIFSTSFSLT
jgi:hypothetical protein